MEETRYLTIMIQSLEKKVSILDQISEKNEEQSALFAEHDPDAQEKVDESVRQKGDLIDQLTQMDDGFHSLYEKVRETLLADPDRYKDEIAQMQTLIRKITEKSMQVQAQEQRNYELADGYFQTAKKYANDKRASHRVAEVYNRNMKKIQVIEPQFMDRKK